MAIGDKKKKQGAPFLKLMTNCPTAIRLKHIFKSATLPKVWHDGPLALETKPKNVVDVDDISP